MIAQVSYILETNHTLTRLQLRQQMATIKVYFQHSQKVATVTNIVHRKPTWITKLKKKARINSAILSNKTLTKNPTACLMCLSSSQDEPAYCKPKELG